jgi:hypothetical protein
MSHSGKIIGIPGLEIVRVKRSWNLRVSSFVDRGRAVV